MVNASLQICKAIHEAKGIPVTFEPGNLYYEKETGLIYCCQNVFKAGPCMVRIGGGNGKGRVMNPNWFIPALNEIQVKMMVTDFVLDKKQIVIVTPSCITEISFKSVMDSDFVLHKHFISK